MAIKGTRAGSRPTKRTKAPTYTQAQVDLLVRDRMRSQRVIARELRQLVLELSRTRQPGRLPGQVSVNRATLLRVLSKSADLEDL